MRLSRCPAEGHIDFMFCMSPTKYYNILQNCSRIKQVYLFGTYEKHFVYFINIALCLYNGQPIKCLTHTQNTQFIVEPCARTNKQSLYINVATKS